jgi:F-type H+-transporting ATPase subunit epsilon
MADGLQLEVVTPDREVVRDAVDEVQVPANTGYLGVLPGHTPLLTAMGTGALSYKMGGETRYVAVMGGFAEVLPDRVTVLAEAAERAEDVDVAAAQADLADAQALLASGATGKEIDWDAALQSLAAANTRLEVAAHAGKTAASAPH